MTWHNMTRQDMIWYDMIWRAITITMYRIIPNLTLVGNASIDSQCWISTLERQRSSWFRVEASCAVCNRWVENTAGIKTRKRDGLNGKTESFDEGKKSAVCYIKGKRREERRRRRRRRIWRRGGGKGIKKEKRRRKEMRKSCKNIFQWNIELWIRSIIFLSYISFWYFLIFSLNLISLYNGNQLSNHLYSCLKGWIV